ncbi:D-alanine--D-alanine ligase [Dokdonia sp. Hel_I_53]|uniref:D-alanine--D-alanine ligase n=1 Tax=Dokdonia sp. Hel_I_53 TaxID=1566287 RepID=UPI001199F26A|nr:D-alanine--D-alanine ligase [Dokdonia sp. Hel_I_53]TVZ51906.1 D-alanine-D-alanine ligase [Dokdonia sp. Hel_I_53]
MQKKNIAVLMGGYGSEYEISLNSGDTVMSALDSKKYNVYEVHILKEGWFCVVDGYKYDIDKSDFSVGINTEKISFSSCYNTIHGTPGEDGKLQAYLELIGIPQTSCAFYESALTFNKRDTLSVLKPYGVPMAKSVYVNKGDNISMEFKNSLSMQIGYPCFVKPNRAGSSFGVSKVYKEGDLEQAIDLAFKEDSEVLIESFLSGTEVSVGVYNFGDGIKVLPVCEIVPDGDFFSLDAKYSGKSQEIVPARISQVQTDEVQQLTSAIYDLLNLKGIARIDFIFHEGKPHFVEVNTNPGLSKESIIPRQFKAAGIALSDAFDKAIQFSIKKI